MHSSPVTQTYNVPVIAPDLRKEETIKQIGDTLEYLEKVTNSIFSKIGARVEENHTRLKNINDRINLAQAKIDTLKGSNKATRVFSSAKYPSSDDIEQYHTVFQQVAPRSGSQTEAGLSEIKRSNYKLTGSHQAVDDRVLKEKLQFYNVNLNTKKKGSENHAEGLGRLPRNVASVSSLLLFNTSENP